jgi:16S rRNA C967 or C1407 C5-methylase (RsmB/RsmF family)/NOL1/NOP2/fmu family ribosome biogenesis protein
MIRFPVLFEERTRELLGNDFQLLKEALHEVPPVSIRLNNRMPDYACDGIKVPWCDAGYYLEIRPRFTADPLLHAGVYYVQEASSMFLHEVVSQLAPNASCVLDLCAAPGGKSTLLSQLLKPGSLLVSNEFVRSRAMILAENLIKWGNPDIAVTNNAPADFQQLPSFFDLLIVDAPCSGEGMFRKDPDSIEEWSLSNVNTCALRQQQILADAWDCLNTNGILIYSTCTYNREENEDTIDYICRELGAELLEIDISRFDGIVFSGKGYRFYPHRINGEGFFISALRKTSGSPSKKRIRNDLRKLQLKSTQQMSEFFLPSAGLTIIDNGLQLFALPEYLKEELLFIRSQLNCLLTGIDVAERKGKDLIPAHQLALSKLLNKQQIARVEVDLPTALNYLKREAITLNNEPMGYVLITYKQQALGWVKNLGTRSNNLYPQHWRIRMNV